MLYLFFKGMHQYLVEEDQNRGINAKYEGMLILILTYWWILTRENDMYVLFYEIFTVK